MRAFEELYLRRPTLEYAQAFDLAAGTLNRGEGPGLAVVSSPVHAVELLKRCPGPVDYWSTENFDAPAFVAEAQGWAWGAASAALLNHQNTKAYEALIWAEPESHSALAKAMLLRSVAQANAVLVVIASAPLRRFLPAWQIHPRPAQDPLSPGAVRRALSKAGWQLKETITFHGPRAVAWTKLAQLLERLGRPDWGDRCLFAMRANYREPGWLWPLAPVSLIRARTI